MKPLGDFLAQVPDWRRAQGKRIQLCNFLEMLVLSGLSGRFGIRDTSRFIKNNADFFIDRYNLQHGVPGQTMLFNSLEFIDFTTFNEAIKQWIIQYLPEDKADFWVAIDGKVLKSTVSDYNNEKHNFTTIVSAFANNLGITIHSTSFENNKDHEAQSARELIEALELHGVTFTLDALHCQKKRSTPSWMEEMII